MQNRFIIVSIGVIFIIICSCQGQINRSIAKESHQTDLVGGPFENSELHYVGMPEVIDAIDTSKGWTECDQKLILSGTIYEIDGITPVANTNIYYWHTDSKGLYSKGEYSNEKAPQHGHLRGWVKTDINGKYTIYTSRPAPYPGSNIPAHIHFSIKEEQIDNPYYIDDLVFDDDPLLLPYFKQYPPTNRGGSGVLRVLVDGEVQLAEHDIILGLNIPNYPKSAINTSGLNIGDDQPSFTPYHIYGSDRGTKTCPVCKYGRFHGILYFVGNNPNWEEIKLWLRFLEKQSVKKAKYLKAYFVIAGDLKQLKSRLIHLGDELKLTSVALTIVPSYSDDESEVNLNKINSNEENTIIIYRHRRIIDKYVSLKPTESNFEKLTTSLNSKQGEFFKFKALEHH